MRFRSERERVRRDACTPGLPRTRTALPTVAAGGSGPPGDDPARLTAAEASTEAGKGAGRGAHEKTCREACNPWPGLRSSARSRCNQMPLQVSDLAAFSFAEPAPASPENALAESARSAQTTSILYAIRPMRASIFANIAPHKDVPTAAMGDGRFSGRKRRRATSRDVWSH